MNSLQTALSSLKESDITMDPYGRLVIENPSITQSVTKDLPNLKRLAGMAASNNCNCPSGGGGGGSEARF